MPLTFRKLVEMNPPGELFDRAKKIFGTTNDVREAGYILPDGTMLNFSGDVELTDFFDEYPPGRYMEHKEICRAVKGGHDPKHPGDVEPYDEAEEEKCVTTFLLQGAIRFNYYDGRERFYGVAPARADTPEIYFDLNVSNDITNEQIIMLRRALQICKREKGICNIVASVSMLDGMGCEEDMPIVQRGSLKDMDNIFDIYQQCRRKALTEQKQYGEVKKEEKPTMKDLMTGTTLNGFIEAAKVKPLTETSVEPVEKTIKMVLDPDPKGFKRSPFDSRWLYSFLQARGGYSIFIAMEMAYEFKKYGVVYDRKDWTKRKYNIIQGRIVGEYGEVSRIHKYVVKVYRDSSGVLIESTIQTSPLDEDTANKIYKEYQKKGYSAQMFRT